MNLRKAAIAVFLLIPLVITGALSVNQPDLFTPDKRQWLETKDLWPAIGGLAGSALLVWLAGFIWNRSLNRQVKLRTEELRRELAESKKAQIALAASEEKFSAVFHYSVEVIGIVRLRDGIFLDVNEAFVKKLGYCKHEVLGHTSREFPLWADPVEREGLYKRLGKENFVNNLEVCWRTREGKVLTGLSSHVTGIINSELCSIFFWHDISDLKRAEQVLRELNEGLEEKVQLRTQALSASNQKLKVLNEGIIAVNEALQDTNRSLVREIQERMRIEQQLACKDPLDLSDTDAPIHSKLI